MTLRELAKKNSCLFWSTLHPEELNEEAIVEGILNYGNWKDIQDLFKIIGVKKAARIFRKQINQKRINYQPQLVNYFKLYFDKYA